MGHGVRTSAYCIVACGMPYCDRIGSVSMVAAIGWSFDDAFLVAWYRHTGMSWGVAMGHGVRTSAYCTVACGMPYCDGSVVMVGAINWLTIVIYDTG